mgnify:CR=1 FL=1
MRKAHIARLFFTMSAVAAAGVWAACGGSDGQDVVQTDAGSDTGGGDGDSGSGQEDSGGPQDSGPKDSGADVKQYDAGKPIILDGGDIEGGIPCVEGGELEEEPNDTPPGNLLTVTRCGVIKIDEVLDAGEKDLLTFTLGDASSTFYLQYAGNVKVMVETDGSAPVDITQGSPVLPFQKGQPYFVEVTSKDGKQQVWRVTKFEE